MSNETTNNTTNLPSEEVLVQQIKGFLRKHNRVKTTYISKETGNEVEAFEKVPRPLKQLNNECWEVGEYLLKALGFCVGKRVYTVSTGSHFRWMFFKHVQGGPKEGGGYWPSLRIGQIWSSSRQDLESGEFNESWWVTVGIKPYKRPEEAQAAQDSEEKASEATDAIDAL